jgi:hypothetical protein
MAMLATSPDQITPDYGISRYSLQTVQLALRHTPLMLFGGNLAICGYFTVI